MSTVSLPHYIDAQKWADRQAVIDDSVALTRFPRFCAALANSDGQVAINLRLYRDAQGFVVLEGTLLTSVSLACQRCLEPVTYDFDVTVKLWLMRDEEAAELLSEEADYILQDENGQISLEDAVEDELILALPLVAAHEDCEALPVDEASVEEVSDTPKRENPFLVLASLKRQ
jgi:uncharacterized protein